MAASLFSGIGAPETAMPHWDWRWCAEIEKFPSAVLAARHPRSQNLGDVSADGFTKEAAEICRPNVIVFGSPCQSFSIAGKRLGLDDPRGNLALVALGIIGQLRPRWFTFENVPGLLSLDGGSAFGLFLRTVDELGYSLAWTVLDAQYFGVAQRRARVFAVGHIGDWRYPAAVLFEPQSLRGHYPPRRQAGQGIAPTIASRPTGGGGLGTDFDCDGGLIEVCPTLRAGAFDKSHANAGVPPVIAFQPKASITQSMNPDVISPTIGTSKEIGAQIGSAVRRLTPRECERLQGFPDDYTAIVYRNKPAADGPRYKSLGNSMAVPVVRWILNRIEQLSEVRAPV